MYAAVENTSESVPAFLVKLWTLVEDPTTDNLIQWDQSGTSFHVYDQQSFSREILPLYFKHNNIASFIRQLNMYGFRKVAHIEQGGLKVEKDDLQFQHQYFQRGERELLQYIKRKVSGRAADSLAAAKPDEYSRVLTDVKQVKTKQEGMEHNLEYIKRENKLLWREVATLRQKHHKQQQIVNKLIQFLVSLVSSNRTGLTIPPFRRMPLAINDASQVAASPPPPPATASAQIMQQTQQANTRALAPDAISHLTTVPPQVLTTQAAQTSDQTYTIESPRLENFLVTPTDSPSGPIIHELTEPFVVPTSMVTSQNNSNDPSLQPLLQPAVSEVVLHTSPSLQSHQGSQVPQFVLVPAIKGGPSAASSSSSSGIQPATVVVSQIDSLMSPKIEAAPSLEDALAFGLSVPSSSSASTVSPPPGTAQAKRKRKSLPEDSASPTKKIHSVEPAASAGEAAVLLTPQPSGAESVKAVLGDLTAATTPGPPLDANLMVTASKDNDEFTLSSDQLDFLSADMDGLKAILQDQYKVDPTFLVELFEASNPWPVIPEQDLDELKVDSEKDDAIASTSDDTSVLGNELVEYKCNSKEELFPELIMTDIDDID